MFNFTTTQINDTDYEFFAGSAKIKLSDIIEDLPDNCYVNKTICGCGATTVSIMNNVDYLILVPFINLLESKKSQHPDVSYVTSETTVEEITMHIDLCKATNSPIKIMGTYDCLKKILTEVPNFDKNKVKLMVDEAHLLVNLASFKAGVCQYILNHYKDFDKYVFVTATPTRREFFPVEIETLPLLTIKWDDVVATNFKTYYLNSEVSMIKKLTALCLGALVDENEREVHIFYNSVHEICNVIKRLRLIEDLDLNSSDFRLVCSKSQALKVKEVAGARLGKISTLADPVCKLNFYTSTAFEGGDVMSNLPHNCEQYICINGSRDHTKLDFTSTVSQIVGRIRNKVDNNIHFLISNAPESIEYTEEEWKREVEIRVKGTEEDLANMYTPGIHTPRNLKFISDGLMLDHYTYYDDNKQKIMLSDVAVKCELQAYQALHATYYVQAEEETESRASRLDSILKEKSKYTDFTISNEPILLQIAGYQYFLKSMKDYCQLKEDNVESKMVSLLEKTLPDFKDYFEILGPKRIKGLGYSQTKIIYALDNLHDKNKSTKRSLDLKEGEFFTNSDLKKLVQQHYDSNRIELKAKASDVSKWYKVRATKKDGVHGLLIEERL